MQTGKIVALGCLAVGVLFYVGSIAGILWGAATPPGDVGVVATSAVFVLFGLVALLLKDTPVQE